MERLLLEPFTAVPTLDVACKRYLYQSVLGERDGMILGALGCDIARTARRILPSCRRLEAGQHEDRGLRQRPEDRHTRSP